jgi:hypothetical protein
MQTHSRTSQAAFSMVETLAGAAAATIVGIGVFAILNTGTMLSARNLALNVTNNALRQSLDRAEQLLQQGDSMPVLIDTTGAATTGPAAGVRFDRFVGAPYVLTIPVAGLPVTTTSLSLQRSTDALAAPPIPEAGDIIRIDGEAATLRPRTSSVVSTAPNAQLRQTMTVTLTAPLGSEVTSASTTLTAKVIRSVALIVMPNGNKRELRYYHSWDLTTNLSDTTKYAVLTDQVGMQADDATPFSLITTQTKSFVNMSFRVRANQFDRRLMGKQADQFNTFSRVDVQIRPKVNP